MAERPVATGGKRNGNVLQEAFTKDDFLQQLQPLVLRLNERGSTWTAKQLAVLLSGFQQFMEDALGVNSFNKPFTRLPAHLMQDLSPDGPLATIGASCGEFMKAKGLKRIDWTLPNMRREYVELFGRIRSELIRSGYVPSPHVYVHPSCGAAALPKLQEAVRSLKGELAQSEGAPGVTHVVLPFPEAEGDPDDGKHYARTLQVKGGDARVHWLYLPDSYDEWIPAAAAPAPGAEPQRKPPRGPWRVYVRWLTDSERYNEWMNPADYETAESAEAEGKRKREGEEEEPARKAKAARQAGPIPEIQAGAGEAVAEGVTKQRVLQPNRKAMDVATAVDISQGQRPEGALMPTAAVQVAPELAERAQQQFQQQGQQQQHGQQQQQQQQQQAEEQEAVKEEGGQQEQQPPQAQQQGQRAQQQQEPYLVPACAAWFRWDGIADVEEAHFKDFLAAHPANPERYRDYRNAVINKYREDPTRELSFTEARRALVGDVNLLRRIWKFLASWQLINFLARRQSGAAAEAAAGAGAGKGAGAACVLGLSGAEALYAPPRRAPVEAGAAAALMGNVGTNSVRVRGSVFTNWARQPALATKAEFYCRGADCGTLCTPLRHHCLKKPDLDLCPKCFKEGKFPAGMCAKDFIRLEAADAVPDESGWTDQETLLLLEGIEKYGESWQQVAEHVGGKSAMQCVARFLQLPTEEALLADASPDPHTLGLVAIPPLGHDGGLAAASAVLEDVIPFADVANPVLAQVSFLAAMVGPKIASAAAQRALEVLAEEDAAAAAGVAQQMAAEEAGVDIDMSDAGGAAPKNGDKAAGEGPFSAARLRLAAATGLAAASVQAKLLADQEEREVQRLVLAAIEHQFKKVNAKLQYLEELDGVMGSERLSLEAMRGKFVDEYAKAVADNVAAGLGPPPGRQAAAQQQQQQPAGSQQQAAAAAAAGSAQ